MEYKNFLLLCAILSCFYLLSAAQEKLRQRQIPRTRFTCVGRPSGYYADLETGCQVYHMCDGLGRQFSYTCPNTTLFQQRMLVCDHWYMVNCSMSERDYDANLLIGQRDKPFVSDEEMRQWTPRPDILTVPANTNYYDGLREAETKYSTHPGNSIVGIPDSISSLNNNGLDSAKVNYRPPTSWSTGTGKRPKDRPRDQRREDQDLNNEETQNSVGASRNVPTFKPSPVDPITPIDNTGFEQTGTGFDQTNSGFGQTNPGIEQTNSGFDQTGSEFDQTGTGFDKTSNVFTQSTERNTGFTNTGTKGNNGFTQSTDTDSSQSNSFTNTNITPPTQDLRPPVRPTTEPTDSEEYQIDARMKPLDDPVVQFINRFDPNSPDSIKTAMTKKEIIDINAQLPNEQTSVEEERTPRKQKINENSFNNLDTNKKGSDRTNSRFDTVNTKPATEATVDAFDVEVKTNQIPLPETDLVPPKKDYSQHTGTTMGPPIYYEWKWAAPAFDLEPPKQSNVTYNGTFRNDVDLKNRSPFRSVTRPTPIDLDPIPPTKNTEYNISSYFVPDYVFPLDKPHPGYEDEHAQSSFQAEVARPGRSYGENPNCPQCHPAYLEPGTCEPCIVKR